MYLNVSNRRKEKVKEEKYLARYLKNKNLTKKNALDSLFIACPLNLIKTERKKKLYISSIKLCWDSRVNSNKWITTENGVTHN